MDPWSDVKVNLVDRTTRSPKLMVQIEICNNLHTKHFRPQNMKHNMSFWGPTHGGDPYCSVVYDRLKPALMFWISLLLETTADIQLIQICKTLSFIPVCSQEHVTGPCPREIN